MADSVKSRKDLVAEIGELQARLAELEQKAVEQDEIANSLRTSNELLGKSQKRYAHLFNEMPTGFSLNEIICDEQGKVCDYRFLQVNRAFEEITGLSTEKVINKTILEVLPKAGADWIETFGKVALTGESAHFTKYSGELDIHCDVIVYCPEPGKFATILYDATKREQMEDSLRNSERMLKEAERIGKIGSWERNLESNQDIWSDQMYRIYEVEPDKFIPSRERTWPYIHPQDQQATKKEYDDAIAQKRPFVGEFRIITGKGSEKIILTRAEPVLGDDGAVQRMIGTVLDITDLRQTEKELRRFKLIADRANYGMVMADTKGHLTYVNQYYAAVHGYTVEEMIGEPWSMMYDAEQLEKVKAIEQDLREKGALYTKEIWHTRKSGEKFCMLVSASVVRDGDGGPQTLVATGVDMTEYLKTQEELETARKQFEQAQRLAEVGTIGGMLAHQLNQPLTVIRILLQAALKEMSGEALPATVVDDIEKSLAAIGTADEVLHQFRRVSGVSRQRTLEKIDPQAIAERMVRILGGSTKNLTLELVVPTESRLPQITGNAVDLEQVFFSLIQNAQQAAGDKPGKLRISAAGDSKVIKLEFADDCGGIEPGNVESVFEPFFTTKEPGEGTGLGLSLVRQIVSGWGGMVEVSNSPGEGATFIVSIPVENQHFS